MIFRLNITSAVKSVDIKDLQNNAHSNIRDYPHDRVPRYKGNELIVIDGVPGGKNLDDVTPSVIKSIQLLTGACAAIYGFRNYGVLVITTK